ncbi:unnamed protein product [Rhizoctonia solani]|uniref:Zn(2)-C6 fungal-type domain-containing protein n=1 Tax=Rhizoctonia solani TaxID=456999 RepID=A0A8H3D9A1_9AGAM|nr:unnamed protein product [Rhizoctonia solani]
MADQIDSVPQTESTKQKAEASAAGTSRSRVYIACTLCRQRKIKCGGEQPACRNCVRIEVACRYDTEPKRRGPDKRPGTRTRTRKNASGTAAPTSHTGNAVSRLPNEPPFVPSQVGPERTKKRTKVPSVPSSNPLPGVSYGGTHVPPSLRSEELGVAGTIPKISPPTLPGELGHAAGNVGRPLAGPNLAPGPSRMPGAPQLPELLASRSLPGAHSNFDTNAGSSVWDQSVHQVSSGDTYGDDAYAYPSGVVVSEEPLASSGATDSTFGYRFAERSRSQPQYVLGNVSTTNSGPGIDVGEIPLNTAGSIGVPSSLSVLPSTTHPGPPSPTFSRLQHTHDPHFRPPQDILAGLAYPRDGVAIPTLERGSRSGATASRSELLEPSSGGGSNLIEARDHFQTSDGYENTGQMVASTSGDGMRLQHMPSLYHSGVSDSSYTYDSSSELEYNASTESVCNDHSRSTQNSTRYQQGSSSSLTTPVSHYGYQDDAGYSSHTESFYSSSGYASQNDGYASDIQTPAEIKVLPPPANPGLLNLWQDGATSRVSQYTSAFGGPAYTSGPRSISNPETGSTYHESTATEDEDQRQVVGNVGYHGAENDFARHLFYNGTGNAYGTSWVSEPSVAFARKTWWDSLLETYAPTKSEAALQITSDLKYLFKSSNYWLSFLNINLFMTNYNHKERRENIQPALILAALAYSTFTQSSEIERGQDGRAKAMQLRFQAQAALDASLNSQRLDPTLAQAAWLLALFEVSAHPEHSTERSRSALMFLDGIIRLLGLTMLDVMDPQTAVFTADKVPTLALSQRRDAPSSAGKLLGAPQAPPPAGTSTCACHALSIACTTAHGQLTPFWVSAPGWDPNWNESEIRREESRRLVWSALTLAAGFTAHDAAFAKDPTELHIIDAANYTLCFPAETMIRQSPSLVHSPQESVWALYGRAMLLWNSCLMLRKKSARMTDAQRAEFAVNVWLETNTIEEALNRHTCSFERNSLFQGREYLFNTRMFISWEFRRYIPSPDTGVHQQFHRRKAEEWLRHQAEVAKRLMQGLHTVTGMASNVLGKRPYFVWWFMSQVSRCLSLWQCDQSLFIALEVARAFLPPIDYLTCLWPCQTQRMRYDQIRQRLHNECVKYGLEPPPPPQLVIPTAIL